MNSHRALVIACSIGILVHTSPARADVVADWSTALQSAQKASGQTSSGRARADSIFREALVGAVTGIAEKQSPARAAEDAPSGADLDAAASQAAYTTLTRLYPVQLAALDTQLATSLVGLPGSAQSITAGRTWGEHVAKTVLGEREMDVYLNAFTFPLASTPAAGPADLAALTEAIGPGRYNFTILAGSPDDRGSADGTGRAARFDYLMSLTVDSSGNVYVADGNNHTIRKVTPDGVVTTLAGLAGARGSADGRGTAARFNNPVGVAVDSSGNVYVADGDNHTVRKVAPDGLVTTLAGLAGSSGSADGTGSAARFIGPADVAVDGAGNLLVADAWNRTICQVTPEGKVTTLAITSASPLYFPIAVTADPAGNIYLLDSVFDFEDWDLSKVTLHKLTPAGEGQFLATAIPNPHTWTATPGFVDGDPDAIAADGAGNLFVHYPGGLIGKFPPNGEPQVHYVGRDTSGFYFTDLALDRSGTLYSLVQYQNPAFTVETGVLVPGEVGPVITEQPHNQEATVGTATHLRVAAVGEPLPTYQWFHNSTALSGAVGTTLLLNNVQAGDTGNYTVVVTDRTGSVTSRTATLTVTSSVSASSVPTPAVTPPAPTQTSTASASSGGGGGAPSGWFLGALSLLCAARRLRRLLPFNPESSADTKP